MTERQRETNKHRDTEICLKEMAHVSVKDGKSEICRAGGSLETQEGCTSQFEFEGSLEAEFLLP